MMEDRKTWFLKRDLDLESAIIWLSIKHDIDEIKYYSTTDHIPHKDHYLTKINKNHNLWYGLKFPIPVTNVKLWIQNEKGDKKITIFETDKSVKSIKFDDPISLIIPYFDIYVSFNIDDVNNVDSINFELWKYIKPYHITGLLNTELKYKLRVGYRDGFGVLKLKPKVKIGEEKETFNILPVKIDLHKLIYG